MIMHVWGQTEAPLSTEPGVCAGTPKAELFREPSFVEVVLNRVYFYSDVSASSVLQLNKRLRELSANLTVEAANQEREPANIFLHVSSYGGSIFAGLAAMEEVRHSRVPVVALVDGCVASAATFMVVAAKKRIIRPNCFMLIHQLSAWTSGNYHQLRDDQKNFDRLMQQIKTIYKQYTKVPEGEVDGILDHDIWWDAETCLKYGLVDEIN
jgi:ATP-dependent protease ClpP protease subunit